jgi:hypothetical protein
MIASTEKPSVGNKTVSRFFPCQKSPTKRPRMAHLGSQEADKEDQKCDAKIGDTREMPQSHRHQLDLRRGKVSSNARCRVHCRHLRGASRLLRLRGQEQLAQSNLSGPAHLRATAVRRRKPTRSARDADPRLGGSSARSPEGDDAASRSHHDTWVQRGPAEQGPKRRKSSQKSGAEGPFVWWLL